MMIISSVVEKQTAKEKARRARVVVLGEFSAGKSTLINLLTGGRRLRTQVTATQMPAVWMSYGTSAPYRVDLEGNEHPVDLDDLSSISTTETAYVRMYMKTPALELCDLIDTPGNSDPNIAAIAWGRVAELADVAIWCSASTQAWRQSEKAAWEDVPERVRKNSILLLTRADKLTSDEDRAKVLRRVTREAGDDFSKIHMASLLEFTDVRDFLRDLIDLCKGIDAPALETEKDTKATLGKTAEDQPEDAHATAREDDAETPVSEMTLEYLDTADESDGEMSSNDAPPPAAPEEGFATALWQQMTKDIPADDPDALSSAFRFFLSTVDAEIESLRSGTAIRAAG